MTLQTTELCFKSCPGSEWGDVCGDSWHYIWIKEKNMLILMVISRSGNTVEKWVTQGSILGPLLLILYTNNLSDWKKTGWLCMFAEDTSLINRCRNALNKAKTDLMRINYLPLNMKKLILWLFMQEETAKTGQWDFLCWLILRRLIGFDISKH